MIVPHQYPAYDPDESLQLRRVPGEIHWEACRAAQRGATAFHRWAWLETMARALDTLFLPLGFYDGGALAGLAPLLVKRRGPYKNANWVPFPYLGPLVPPALWSRALRALDDYQRRNGIGLIQLGFAPHAVVDADALRAAGYTVRTDTTMVLPLAGRGEAELWAGLTTQGRKNIKRARRDVEVRPATEQDITRELPAIMDEVFAPRHQPPPYPPAATRLFWERYHGDPAAYMVAAHCEGAVAAVSTTIGDGRRAYFWECAGRRRFRHANPNAAAFWDAILWARARGYAELDMVGTPDAGIAQYKATFGAVARPYIVATRENARLAAWARRAHNRARLMAHGHRHGRAGDAEQE